jgi:hypothetical protein
MMKHIIRTSCRVDIFFSVSNNSFFKPILEIHWGVPGHFREVVEHT